MNSKKTIIWFDFETFGKDTKTTRPSQFGWVRTDMNLNILDKGILYSKLAKDYIPSIEACRLTKITPQECEEKGELEVKFAKKIFDILNEPNTISIGYNSRKFDNEILRFMFYRNFLDPYSFTWKNGCEYRDFMDFIYTFYSLDREKINWKEKEDGRISFKLEDIGAINNIDMSGAHDAMVDVLGMIEVAKLVKSKNEDLFNYYFDLDKKEIASLIATEKFIVHYSNRYKKENNFIGFLYRIKRDKNKAFYIDLLEEELDFSKTKEELKKYKYLTNEELEKLGEKRPAIHQLEANKMPLIMDGKNSLINLENTRLISNEVVRKKYKLLKEKENLENYSEIFSIDWEEEKDCDMALYNGFLFNISRGDREAKDRVVNSSKEELKEIKFKNKVLAELFFRFKGRNYPEILSYEELKRWEKYLSETYKTGRGLKRLNLLEESIQKCDLTNDIDAKLREYLTSLKISKKKKKKKESLQRTLF